MKNNKNSSAIVLDVLKCVLFAFYTFLFYQLLAVPAILDWSVFGIALSIVLVIALVWSFPKGSRRRWAVLALAFLLAVKSLNNLQDYKLLIQLGGLLVILIVLMITSVLAGNIKLRQYMAVFMTAVLLTYMVNLSEIPFWSEFTVKWESPLLYPKNESVDYFPLQTVDVNGDGVKEIIARGNLKKAEEYVTADKSEPFSFLQPEANQTLVFQRDGNGFKTMAPGSYDIKAVVQNLRPDYINFPYYNQDWSFTARQGLSQKLEPQLSRTELIDVMSNFGMVPFRALELDLSNIDDRKDSIKQLYGSTGTPFKPSDLTMDYKQKMPVDNKTARDLLLEGTNFVGKYGSNSFSASTKATAIMSGGKLVKGQSTPDVALLGRSLQVLELAPGAGKPKGEITDEEVGDIGTGEVLTADVNNDKTDELLVNTAHAKILQLQKDGKWQVIWNSPDDSFRFEDYNTLGREKTPEIIALSKSLVRDNPTRFITSYTLTPSGLKTNWRVFTGLINLQAADVDGDGKNELVGYLYKEHKVFVLKKHHVPVTEILYAVTGLLIAYGVYRRYFGKKPGEVV